MSDLIDRQEAIDALARTAREKFNLSDEFNHYLAGLMDGETAIRQLPSAQPEKTQFSGESTTKDSTFDCISRRAAIDAIKASSKEIQHWLWEAEGCEGYCAMVADVETCLDDLPSVQPDIIRCKDCKYWEGERRGYFYYFEQCSLHERTASSDDFCSWAERREE